MTHILKRLLLSISALAVVFTFASPSVALAFEPFEEVCSGNSSATVCKDAGAPGNPIFGPDGIVVLIVNILTVIIGVAAVIVIIIAGIQYMLSTGDATKINNAKNTILYALAGLVIAVVSRTIVVYVISRL